MILEDFGFSFFPTELQSHVTRERNGSLVLDAEVQPERGVTAVRLIFHLLCSRWKHSVTPRRCKCSEVSFMCAKFKVIVGFPFSARSVFTHGRNSTPDQRFQSNSLHKTSE